ncbi:Anthrax Toxin Receptor-Like [Manis pentadactyla]|nr:Anthrax Toxin Receptor-Like [Manis pentadactyla]
MEQADVRVCASAPQEGECGEQCRDDGSLWRLTPGPSTGVVTLASPADYNIISLVIALSAGKLLPKTFQEATNEAKKARNLRAKVYLVGVKDYSKDQLSSIAERKNQVYGAEKGFKSLEDVVFPLVRKSCNDIMEPLTAKFYHPGLSVKKDDIVCRLKGDTGVLEKEPIRVNSEFIVCPAYIFQKEGEMVEIEYSLDKGISFINGSLKFIGVNCDMPPEEEPTKPVEVGQEELMEPVEDPQEEPTEPTVPEAAPRAVSPFLILCLVPVPALFVLLLLLLCIWCYKKEETMEPTTIPQEETMKPTTVPQETTEPTSLPQEETTEPMTIPQEENMKPMTVPQEETMEPTTLRQEETTEPMTVP